MRNSARIDSGRVCGRRHIGARVIPVAITLSLIPLSGCAGLTPSAPVTTTVTVAPDGAVDPAGAALPSSAPATSSSATTSTATRTTASATQTARATRTARATSTKRTGDDPDRVTAQENELFGRQGGAGSPEDRRAELRAQGWVKRDGVWRKERTVGQREKGTSGQTRRDDRSAQQRASGDDASVEEPTAADWERARQIQKRRTKKQVREYREFCQKNSGLWHEEYGCSGT